MTTPKISGQLLQKTLSGDPSALTQFLHDLWPWLRRKAQRYVAPGGATAPIGVSTLAVETALRFSRKIKSVRATSSPRVLALLDRIMRNTAQDAHRDARTQKRDPGVLVRLDGTDPAADPSTADQPPQFQQLAYAEFSADIQTALAGLPERQREAFLLHAEGVQPAEIAARLHCSPSAASMLVQRARQDLQLAVAQHTSTSTDGSSQRKK